MSSQAFSSSAGGIPAASGADASGVAAGDSDGAGLSATGIAVTGTSGEVAGAGTSSAKAIPASGATANVSAAITPAIDPRMYLFMTLTSGSRIDAPPAPVRVHH